MITGNREPLTGGDHLAGPPPPGDSSLSGGSQSRHLKPSLAGAALPAPINIILAPRAPPFRAGAPRLEHLSHLLYHLAPSRVNGDAVMYNDDLDLNAEP